MRIARVQQQDGGVRRVGVAVTWLSRGCHVTGETRLRLVIKPLKDNDGNLATAMRELVSPVLSVRYGVTRCHVVAPTNIRTLRSNVNNVKFWNSRASEH